MIIVKIMGGLGNQMFQYAAAKSLAKYHNTDLKLDISFYNDHRPNITPREFKLFNFNVETSIATEEEISSFMSNSLEKYLKYFYLKLLHKRDFYFSSIFKEDDFTRFNPKFFATPHNVYLNGYWGSEKYFEDISPVIREDFSLHIVLSLRSRMAGERIRESSAVSLHVRRGDYVSRRTNSIFYPLPVAYYEKAVQYIEAQVDNIEIFVFSDDPYWVQKNLNFSHPVTFITFNGAARDYEDMWLMSLCKYHIIANSTFSWWGAWLATFPDQIVVAPQNWYSPQSGIKAADLLPERWIRL